MNENDNLLGFTDEQFQTVVQSMSDRMQSREPLIEKEFEALATSRVFAERFIGAAISAGLNPEQDAVMHNVRALAITFFMYGKELGSKPTPKLLVN